VLLPVSIGGTGLWRSLVAHLTGGQVVAGSNPVSPTQKRSWTFEGTGRHHAVIGRLGAF
jgi:hypothetical protein